MGCYFQFKDMGFYRGPYNSDERVVMFQDSSHVFKKIRNSLLKSGFDKSIRRIEFNGGLILWDYFISAYQWDKGNILSVHQKLTHEHIFPNQPAKMRNHLAEQVLDDDMLNMMTTYQASKDDGSYFDSTIARLEKTSVLISIFRDQRAVKNIADSRLSALLNIHTWFKEWEVDIVDKFPKYSEANRRLISKECREDISSLILGFYAICQKRLLDTHFSIIPCRINSDPIENLFCQQRATYHGSSDNPNVQSYQGGLISVIFGHNTVSRKSSASRGTPQSYTFYKYAEKMFSYSYKT